MSVLIKGMEMPTGCLSCGFCNPFVDEPYCRRLMRRTPKVSRLDGCPLIEIPDGHGRLIDADALMNDGWTLNKQVMRMGGYAIHEMPLDNPNVPIVIPADKDGEA